MHRADFVFDLPEELIAQSPLTERSASRLLVLDGASGALRDASFRDLPALLEPGDLLVFNDTRVVAARLLGFKPSGGRVEIFLERPLPSQGAGWHRALVQLRASKAIRFGATAKLDLMAQVFNLLNTRNLQAQYGGGRVGNALRDRGPPEAHSHPERANLAMHDPQVATAQRIQAIGDVGDAQML